jgi:hypothetical protein
LSKTLTDYAIPYEVQIENIRILTILKISAVLNKMHTISQKGWLFIRLAWTAPLCPQHRASGLIGMVKNDTSYL